MSGYEEKAQVTLRSSGGLAPIEEKLDEAIVQNADAPAAQRVEAALDAVREAERTTDDEGAGEHATRAEARSPKDKTGDVIFVAASAGDTVSVIDKYGIKSTLLEPKNYREAMRSADREKWLESMQIEFDTLEGADVYRLVPASYRLRSGGGCWGVG